MRTRSLRLFTVAVLAAGLVAVGGTPGPTRAEVTTPVINVLYGTLSYGGSCISGRTPQCFNSGYYRIGFEFILPAQTVTFRQKFYSAAQAPDDATFNSLPIASPASETHPNSPVVTMNGAVDPYQSWEANGTAGAEAYGQEFRWQLVLNGSFGEAKSDIITFTTLTQGSADLGSPPVNQRFSDRTPTHREVSSINRRRQPSRHLPKDPLSRTT
jgi:hypothetical protein